MATVKVRYNKQIMRRGKIYPVGSIFEIDEKELPAAKKAGAVKVVEKEVPPPPDEATLEPVENGIDNDEPLPISPKPAAEQMTEETSEKDDTEQPQSAPKGGSSLASAAAAAKPKKAKGRASK